MKEMEEEEDYTKFSFMPNLGGNSFFPTVAFEFSDDSISKKKKHRKSKM